MKFSEVVGQAVAWLQREGRVSYRALKLEFDLNDDSLDALKEELIEVKELAVDKDGKMLVWAGSSASSVQSLESQSAYLADARRATLDPRPISYTHPHLAERIRAEQAALEAREATDGERKTITALFADLKGSTALIEGLDPEEARALIDPALQLMMDAVHRYEGYVAKTLGDGILALFGAPIAHEDHPQRALYAALRMQEEMRRYADTLRAKGTAPLFMRVGVNTGAVVVRFIRKDDLQTDYDPIGHSTHVAARMEQLATPGAIVVSAYTHKLTDGYFAFKDLGPTQIKGIEEPLNIYEVVGVGPLRTRLQASARRGLTRFVGRQSELKQLQHALARAKTGQGQIVGTMGEPGLGKSRLFYEFKLLSLSGCLVLEAYSVSHGKASPYLPVIELLKSYFRIEPPDDERTRREKVAGKVLMLDRSLENTLPYLFALLGIEEQPSPLQQMDPQIRRRRTFDAIKKLFLRESLNQPLVLIFEDLHWIDSETQGFLDVLSESMANAQILLLVNYRPEYRQEWGQKTYYTQLQLTPLGKAEVEEFLNALLGTSVGAQHAAPLQSLKQVILEKTQGTPFFMEEIVQELAERGVLKQDLTVGWVVTQPTTDLHIPTTVQGVLAARIDRLAPDEKALLQQLAVIGREFPLSLIRQVIRQPEDELYHLLSALQHKEFLYEQPAFPEVEYIFKHALTQEVAYSSVLIERRKALHEQTGQAIERLYKDNLEEHYSELAHHYSRSSNTEKAIAYLGESGKLAAHRSAYLEAITQLTAALDMLKTLPNTRIRVQQELILRLTLGAPLAAIKGYAAAEVEDLYTRARALCQEIGETPQLFPTLRGLWIFYFARTDWKTARILAEQLVSLAYNSQDSAMLVEAHGALGQTLFWIGEFPLAWANVEQAITLYDQRQHAALAFLSGYDPGVASLCRAMWILWVLGYPEQALQKSREALTLARELGHPQSLALALDFTAFLHLYRRDWEAAQEPLEAALTLSTERGFAQFLAVAEFKKGWALAESGKREAGIVQMHNKFLAQQRTGNQLGLQHWFVLLAEAYGKAGQIDEGLKIIGQGFALIEENGGRSHEAELYRLKGELTLQKESQVQGSEFQATAPQSLNPDPQGEAEACFLKAIEIARQQQAKSWELRATMSLVHLWRSQGQHHVAREMLANIYNWFTEGFDTVDLKEAKALLEELAGAKSL